MKKRILVVVLTALTLSGCGLLRRPTHSGILASSEEEVLPSNPLEESEEQSHEEEEESEADSEIPSEEDLSIELSEELSEEHSEEISESSLDESSHNSSEDLSSESLTSLSEDSSEETQSSISSEEITSSESEDVVDLGVMSIADVKQYIKDHPFELNSHGLGIDQKHQVTIKGYALNKFDLVKTKKSFGLDVSYPAKVMMGDDTGYIACASSNGDGTTLYGKVSDYAGQDTSRYEVTGYLSVYLGQPEISVPLKSFTWNEKLDVIKDIDAYVEDTITLENFYSKAKDIHYNCAGHGYDGYYRINGLTCYSYDANAKYYYMTDGQRMIKVLKDSISMTVGNVYDVIGLMTTKDYQPGLRGLSVTVNTSVAPVTPDLGSTIEKSATDLLKIKTSQDDTDSRFDDFILSFGNIYRAEVYMGLVTENSKYYVAFSDAYKGSSALNDIYTSGSTKGMIFIDNKNFWNVDETDLSKYNPYYADYILEEVTTTVYYFPVMISYKQNKPIWKVFLLNETMPS